MAPALPCDGRKRMNYKKKSMLAGYMYILPSLVIILIFSVVPTLTNIVLSFTKYSVINPPVAVGLANYARMFRDPFVVAALRNTIVYTLIVVPLQTVLSLLIAAVITAKFRGGLGDAIKSILFIPVISSMVLSGAVWSFMLASDKNGVVNSLLGLFGISPLNWLGSTKYALVSVCIVAIWRMIGYYLVIFYAGIIDIPRTTYEAAEVDGANKLQQFRFITLPGLKPITFLVVTLGTIWSFQVFDLVFTMTSGGPGRSTVTLVLTVYTAAFREYNMGYASAIACLLLVLTLIISTLQRLLFQEKREGDRLAKN